MSTIFIVGIGGFIGAVCRFGLANFVRSHFSHSFPFATLVINFLGCAGIGLFFELFKEHQLFSALSLFVVVGFLGAFTTFSTFSWETVELVRGNQLHLAVLNVAGSVALCLVGVLFGEWLGHL